MLYLSAIVLGIVQGLTEFLPVSSSGHLVVLHDIFKLQFVDNLAFDVSLHLGTLLALIIFFRVEILRYLAAVVETFIPQRAVNKADAQDVLLLIYASIPAALAGFLLNEFIEKSLRQPGIVIIALALGAFLFFLVEKFCQTQRDFTGLNLGKAVFIGLAQAVALIPGVSRSGITIVAGMAMKLKREEAARFTFLLSIPVVFGAGIFKFFGINWEALSLAELGAFLVGLLSSFGVGWLTVKYFLRFLRQHTLIPFAWYRLGLAALLLIWLLIK